MRKITLFLPIVLLVLLFNKTYSQNTGYGDDFEGGSTLSTEWVDYNTNYNLIFNNSAIPTGNPNANATKKLRVDCPANGGGKNWADFQFDFPTIDVTSNPFVSVKVFSGTGTGFTLRIDMVDETGRVTNQIEANNIIKTGAWNDYFFDFTGKFYQQWPEITSGPVDATKITKLQFIFNPGDNASTGYSGTVYIDSVMIGSKAKVVGNTINGIKFNQLGFYPKSKKVAVVNGAKADSFYVVSQNLQDTLFKDTLSASKSWSYSGEVVRLADFSKIQSTGIYYMRVPGLNNVSEAINISDNAFTEIDKASLKMFYYQRNSSAITTQYGGKWSRLSGHPDNAVKIHASAATASRPTNSTISASKGWYDAGDYNKYVVNAGISTYTLLAAYEHYSTIYDTLGLNIPESGGALPDILAEIKWNLDWMIAMQDPEDGGVYTKLTNLNFDNDAIMPANANSTDRYVIMKSTAATLDFAAVFAQAARVYSSYDQTLATTYIDAAIRAFKWAENYPNIYYYQNNMNANYDPDITTGGYGDGYLGDEFNWAACELYITTGNLNYYNYINYNINVGAPGWPDVNTLGYISMSHHEINLKNGVDATAFKNKLITTANTFKNYALKNSAYQIPMGENAGNFSWGSNAVAANQSLVLLQAFAYTKDSSYLFAAQGNLDYLLGRNPMRFSYVTGFGNNSPLKPHHRPMEGDGITEPIPGFLVGGPHSGQQDGCVYPSNLPALSYLDETCSYSTNEIAINWNAPLAYILGSITAIYKGVEPTTLSFNVTPSLSTTKAQKATSIYVYPNPNEGNELYANTSQTIENVEIYTVEGAKQFTSFTISNLQTTINTSQLENGLYIIKLTDKDGNVYTSKFNKVK
jgi:endoglucanase